MNRLLVVPHWLDHHPGVCLGVIALGWLLVSAF